MEIWNFDDIGVIDLLFNSHESDTVGKLISSDEANIQSSTILRVWASKLGKSVDELTKQEVGDAYNVLLSEARGALNMVSD